MTLFKEAYIRLIVKMHYAGVECHEQLLLRLPVKTCLPPMTTGTDATNNIGPTRTMDIKSVAGTGGAALDAAKPTPTALHPAKTATCLKTLPPKAPAEKTSVSAFQANFPADRVMIDCLGSSPSASPAADIASEPEEATNAIAANTVATAFLGSAPTWRNEFEIADTSPPPATMGMGATSTIGRTMDFKSMGDSGGAALSANPMANASRPAKTATSLKALTDKKTATVASFNDRSSLNLSSSLKAPPMASVTSEDLLAPSGTPNETEDAPINARERTTSTTSQSRTEEAHVTRQYATDAFAPAMALTKGHQPPPQAVAASILPPHITIPAASNQRPVLGPSSTAVLNEDANNMAREAVNDDSLTTPRRAVVFKGFDSPASSPNPVAPLRSILKKKSRYSSAPPPVIAALFHANVEEDDASVLPDPEQMDVAFMQDGSLYHNKTGRDMAGEKAAIYNAASNYMKRVKSTHYVSQVKKDGGRFMQQGKDGMFKVIDDDGKAKEKLQVAFRSLNTTHDDGQCSTIKATRSASKTAKGTASKAAKGSASKAAKGMASKSKSAVSKAAKSSTSMVTRSKSKK